MGPIVHRNLSEKGGRSGGRGVSVYEGRGGRSERFVSMVWLAMFIQRQIAKVTRDAAESEELADSRELILLYYEYH